MRKCLQPDLTYRNNSALLPRLRSSRYGFCGHHGNMGQPQPLAPLDIETAIALRSAATYSRSSHSNSDFGVPSFSIMPGMAQEYLPPKLGAQTLRLALPTTIMVAYPLVHHVWPPLKKQNLFYRLNLGKHAIETLELCMVSPGFRCKFSKKIH